MKKGEIVSYFGRKMITDIKTAKELSCYPYDETLLVELDHNKGYWFQIDWIKNYKKRKN